MNTRKNTMPKRILIVGGSSGLGRRLAELYAAEGCKIGIIGRRENLLEEIRQQFPFHIHTCIADISIDEISKKIIDLINTLDGIDILIIAASIGEINEDLNASIENKTIETNVNGYLQVLITAWHYFFQKGSGHIAGITSIAAIRGNKMAPAYNASKAFQSNYLEGLRVKAKNENKKIIITELIPGYINTAMGKGDRMFWVSSVEKAARQCIKAIAKKRSRAFITKRWWLAYTVLKFLPIFIHDPLMNASWKMKQKPK